MKSPAPLPSEEISKAEIIENWALFLAVIGTIPWAIYLINDVFPRWDIHYMKLGIMIFCIIIRAGLPTPAISRTLLAAPRGPVFSPMPIGFGPPVGGNDKGLSWRAKSR